MRMTTSQMPSNMRGAGGAPRRGHGRSLVALVASLSMVMLASGAIALTPDLAAAATEPTAPTPEAGTAPEPEASAAPTPVGPAVAFAVNAECDPAAGHTTLVWELTNNGAVPVQITDITEPVTLEPNVVPPGATATASRVIDGPTTDEQGTSTVTIDASGVVTDLSDEITAGACEGPAAPPDVAFTLSVTPSVSQAAVGDTVEYVDCARNTSTIPLAEPRLVDDRMGVVLKGEEPIAPGATVCNTDVGAPAMYV